MKDACLPKIEKVTEVLDNVVASLEELKQGINEDDEEKVNEAIDSLPSPKQVAKALETLGNLIESKPWEDKRRKNA